MIVNKLYPSPPAKSGLRFTTSESEYKILTDFATRLSSYVNERNSHSPSNSICLNDHNIISDNDSIEEDAELLMSLMSSLPVSGSLELVTQTDVKNISPSLSFETNNLCLVEHEDSQDLGCHMQPAEENDCHQNQDELSSDSRDDNCNIVKVIYPCLSLLDFDSIHSSVPGGDSPINLLSRPAHVMNKPSNDAIKFVANQLAVNMMSSLKIAVDWRVKVWISQLLKCVRTKSSTNEFQEFCSQTSSSKNIEYNSSDVKLIRALLCTLSSVSVSDVRTTVQVLEQQAISSKTSENRDLFERSLHISGDCNLTHAVNMDFNLTISNRFDDSVSSRMNVSLQTQGFIHGAFYRTAEDSLVLADVELMLDTALLCHGIERQSRSIARSFAGEYISSCHPALYPYVPQAKTIKKIVETSSSPSYSIQPMANVAEKDDESSVKSSLDRDDSPITTSLDTYAFPIVTPHQDSDHSDSTYVSLNIPATLSVKSIMHQKKRPRLSPSKYIVQPRRVSPNFLKSDSSLESLKEDSITVSASSAPGYTDSYQYLNLPSIISPNPVNDSTVIDGKTTSTQGNAPSLPLIAELVSGIAIRQVTK
jgi:hypothetical protein